MSTRAAALRAAARLDVVALVAVDVLHLEARPAGGVAEGEAVREPGARVELVGDQDGRRVVAAGRVVGRADGGRIEQPVTPGRVVDAPDRRVDAGRDRHTQLKADVEPGPVLLGAGAGGSAQDKQACGGGDAAPQRRANRAQRLHADHGTVPRLGQASCSSQRPY